MKIYLIRHTSINCETGVCYGASDVDVSATFNIEAEEVKNKIKLENIEHFYSSPLKRCQILTEYLSSGDFKTDSRLKEINFGDWELKKWDLIDKEQYFFKWSKDFVNLRCPNGESFQDVYDRTSCFFKELLEKDYQKVGLVIHGGVIRSILCYIFKMPIENSYSIGLDYGGVTKIKVANGIIKTEFINK